MSEMNAKKNREITENLERLKKALSNLSATISSLPVELEPILAPERPEKDVAQPGGSADSPLGRELNALASDAERMGYFLDELMQRIAL